MMSLRTVVSMAFSFAVALPAAAQAGSGLDDTFNASLACKSHFVSALFDQQVRFSNSHLTPCERRDAENRIDNARIRLDKTHDYCQALEELGKDTYSHLEAEMGDVHEFHGEGAVHNG